MRMTRYVDIMRSGLSPLLRAQLFVHEQTLTQILQEENDDDRYDDEDEEMDYDDDE
jgi:hypothetical protein